MDFIVTDPLVALTARLFLGLFLVAAAVHKLRSLRAFTSALAGYRLVPRGLLQPFAISLMAMEIVVGAALVFDLSITGIGGIGGIAGFGALAIFGLYFAAIALNLARGNRAIDCGCSFGARASRLSGWHLVRLGALMLASTLPMMAVSARALQAFDFLNAIGGIVALGILYLAADQLLTNHGRMQGRRIQGDRANA